MTEVEARHSAACEPNLIKEEPLHIKEEPPHIKEEPPHIKEEPEEFPFNIVVKTEDDEDSSDTDRSEDYSQHQDTMKRSYAMVPADSRPFSCSTQRPSMGSESTPSSRSPQTVSRPVNCSHCGKSFKYKSQLQSHIVIHTGERLFKCPVCEKGFSQNSSLKAHIKIHSGEKPHVCSICDKSFTLKGALNVHMKTHTSKFPHFCSVCVSRFHKKRFLNEHLKSVHHICPVCKSHFPDDIKLFAHLTTHATQLDSDSEDCDRSEEEETAPDSTSFSCSEDKPFSCLHCRKSFKRKSQLQNHMLVHTREKPHKCSVCDKCYSLRSNLNSHMKIHLETFPHKCSVCDKRFEQSHTLEEHQQCVHHICPICKSRFPDEIKLFAHLTTHD